MAWSYSVQQREHSRRTPATLHTADLEALRLATGPTAVEVSLDLQFLYVRAPSIFQVSCISWRNARLLYRLQCMDLLRGLGKMWVSWTRWPMDIPDIAPLRQRQRLALYETAYMEYLHVPLCNLGQMSWHRRSLPARKQPTIMNRYCVLSVSRAYERTKHWLTHIRNVVGLMIHSENGYNISAMYRRGRGFRWWSSWTWRFNAFIFRKQRAW